MNYNLKIFFFLKMYLKYFRFLYIILTLKLLTKFVKAEDGDIRNIRFNKFYLLIIVKFIIFYSKILK
ncbi:hypothetical protein U3516DRAFT_182101 [Neocallimastix sp. 'constans']